MSFWPLCEQYFQGGGSLYCLYTWYYIILKRINEANNILKCAGRLMRIWYVMISWNTWIFSLLNTVFVTYFYCKASDDFLWFRENISIVFRMIDHIISSPALTYYSKTIYVVNLTFRGYKNNTNVKQIFCIMCHWKYLPTLNKMQTNFHVKWKYPWLQLLGKMFHRIIIHSKKLFINTGWTRERNFLSQN